MDESLIHQASQEAGGRPYPAGEGRTSCTEEQMPVHEVITYSLWTQSGCKWTFREVETVVKAPTSRNLKSFLGLYKDAHSKWSAVEEKDFQCSGVARIG